MPARREVQSLVTRAHRVLLWLAESERLPEPPASDPVSRQGFLRWLLAPEPLPAPTRERSSREVSAVSWLLRREPLPSSPEEPEP